MILHIDNGPESIDERSELSDIAEEPEEEEEESSDASTEDEIEVPFGLQGGGGFIFQITV